MLFYIEPSNKIFKTYGDFFEDLTLVNVSDVFLQENDTYIFFVKLIKKIILNHDFFILDSDFSEFEKQDLMFDNQIVEILENGFSEKSVCFDDFLSKIKSSTSQISIFSSGTTGKPKKVIHNIQTLISAVNNKIELQNCVWALAYNPTHIAGIQVFFQAFFNQNTLVDVFGKSRRSIYEVLDKYIITHISATPTFYRLLFPFEREFKEVLRITFGGEKSDIRLYEKLQKLFPNSKVTNIYASTELGTLLYSNSETFTIPDSKKNSILIRENELFVSSTLLGKSDYQYTSDGFYKTGDIVEIITYNPLTFKFKSRSGDYVNVGGLKVNIQEIEDVLSSIDGVLIASVEAKSNSILGNILIGFVVSDYSNLELSEKYILTILKNKLQGYKIPRVIKIVEKIEYSRTGKILKNI